VLVCAGVLRLSLYPNPPQSKFKTPYINAKYFMPVILLATTGLLFYFNPDVLSNYFSLDLSESWDANLDHILHKVIYAGFVALFIGITIVSVWKNLSLIPVLGLLSCAYLLCESGASNWWRFIAWLLLGFIIYFAYGYSNSKLARK
ncbi:MAG: amino acid transporter, partial [Bacteroidetes bacterium]|nr:amino acid transporter [Bacteroidota bacterium]